MEKIKKYFFVLEIEVIIFTMMHKTLILTPHKSNKDMKNR